MSTRVKHALLANSVVTLNNVKLHCGNASANVAGQSLNSPNIESTQNLFSP
jgi:hypothetical protein